MRITEKCDKPSRVRAPSVLRMRQGTNTSPTGMPSFPCRMSRLLSESSGLSGKATSAAVCET
jgi:hypothetical protein